MPSMVKKKPERTEPAGTLVVQIQMGADDRDRLRRIGEYHGITRSADVLRMTVRKISRLKRQSADGSVGELGEPAGDRPDKRRHPLFPARFFQDDITAVELIQARYRLSSFSQAVRFAIALEAAGIER